MGLASPGSPSTSWTRGSIPGRSSSSAPSRCRSGAIVPSSRSGSTRSSTCCSRKRSGCSPRGRSGSTRIIHDSSTSMKPHATETEGGAAPVTEGGPARVHRALISVSDKTGVVEFARGLQRLGVAILSTGGTAGALRAGGVDVTDVAELTGSPEILDGRVKTLHPRLHAAVLAVRDDPDHAATLESEGIEPIDLVCVNLYPFEQTVVGAEVSEAEAIENIDVGGPTMI